MDACNVPQIESVALTAIALSLLRAIDQAADKCPIYLGSESRNHESRIILA